MLKLILIAVVAAHAIGHVLFLGPGLRLATWADQTGHSWVLSAPLGDALTRGVAGFIWSATIVLFLFGVIGYATDQEWWRAPTIAGALVSIVGIVVFWDGIAASSAMFALAFDALVLIALLWARWPSPQVTP
jgi:hypothetical protein